MDSGVENQIKNGAGDNYGFENSQPAICDDEEQEEKCERGNVELDGKHGVSIEIENETEKTDW
jgi:hypothetical protein